MHTRTCPTAVSRVKAPDGHLVLTKVVNISVEGLLMLSPEHLPPLHDRRMLIEIPAIDDCGEKFKVDCRATIRHAVLSGDYFKIGAHLKEISALHKELVRAWMARVLRELA